LLRLFASLGWASFAGMGSRFLLYLFLFKEKKEKDAVSIGAN